MPTHCSALNCKNRDTPECRKSGITFHRLPTDLSKKLEWCRNIGRIDSDGSVWVPKSKSYLCSNHFESHLFHIKGTRKLLSSGSIPTIFNFISSTKRKNVASASNNNSENQNFFVIAEPQPRKRRKQRLKNYNYSSDEDGYYSTHSEEEENYISESSSENIEQTSFQSRRRRRGSKYASKINLSPESISSPPCNKISSSLVDSDDSSSNISESEDDDDHIIETDIKTSLVKEDKLATSDKQNHVNLSDYLKVEVKEECDYYPEILKEEMTLDLLSEISRHFLQHDTDPPSDPFEENDRKILHLTNLVEKSRKELENLETRNSNLNLEVEKIKKILVRNIKAL